MPKQEELQAGFNLGEWEILPGHGVFRRGDQEERPEPKVFEVLMALAKRDTNLVTKQELVEEVWDGRPTSDEPIARCISQLRGHLDDRKTPHQYIETLQRRGYRLKQHVELHQPSEIEAAPASAGEDGASPRLWKALAAFLAIGFVAIAAFTWITPPPARSIAVMPFENLSGQQSDEYLVLGFKEELVQMLQGLDDYTVKNGRVSYEMESAEIAELLGVESVLFGALRRDGDELKINYRISTGGNVVQGDGVEGVVEKLFELQESLAIKVRNNLVGESRQTLIKSRPSDSDAYDSYMRGVYALERRGDPEKFDKAIERFQEAIDLDEKYGPSYLALATLYVLMPTYQNAPWEEMDDLALKTIDAGVRADPLIEDAANMIYGAVYHHQKRWEDSEEAYLRAISADVVDSNAFNWYSRMLASVGRLDDALLQALAGLELDPSSPSLNSRVAMTYAWTLQTDKAFEFYERSVDVDWTGTTHNLSYSFILLRTEQLEIAQDMAMAAALSAKISTDWVEPSFDALGDASKTAAAIDALNDESMSRGVPELVQLTLRALLGDLNGAMQVAETLEGVGEEFEMDLLFAPELKAFRQHPDFMPLLDRLGVTRYWASKGCIWSGDRVICPAS
jgi:DNA-binding winged helix-turn-helix (wHTH) protein/TolB-like protein